MYVFMSSLVISRDIEDGHTRQSCLRLEGGRRLLSIRFIYVIVKTPKCGTMT